jgi:sporulation protein YlmC with PRC-barrel domain
MKLKKGADVFNSKGEKLGALQRVIIDPDTKTITHIVVEKGWLFSTNRVISMSEVDAQRDDGLVVTSTNDDPDSYPAFEEAHYVNLDENDHPDTDVEGAYWYPPANLAWWRTSAAYMGYYPPIPSFVVRTTQNIPDGTVALEEGAKLLARMKRTLATSSR